MLFTLVEGVSFCWLGSLGHLAVVSAGFIGPITAVALAEVLGAVVLLGQWLLGLSCFWVGSC